MSRFIAEIEDSLMTREYLRGVDTRLSGEEDLLSVTSWPTMFFRGSVTLLSSHAGKVLALFEVNVLFPPVHLLLALALGVSGILFGSTWLVGAGCLFCLPSLLYWRYTHVLLLKIALRQNRMRVLNYEQVCEVIRGTR